MGWTDERVEQLKAFGPKDFPRAKLPGSWAVSPQCRDRQGSPPWLGRPRGPCPCRAAAFDVVPVGGSHRRAGAEIIEEDPVVLEDGKFATVLTINDRMCRWPIGDPAENEFHFCGRKPKTGTPYCERMRARPISRNSSVGIGAPRNSSDEDVVGDVDDPASKMFTRRTSGHSAPRHAGKRGGKPIHA